MISPSKHDAVNSNPFVLPAGGVSSPPSDPPAASGKPLQGQEETNRPLLDAADDSGTASSSEAVVTEDEMLWRAAAMDLGRKTYFRHAGERLQFAQAEEELVRAWDARQQSGEPRVSWELAREVVQDAWEQVHTALASDESKPSAR